MSYYRDFSGKFNFSREVAESTRDVINSWSAKALENRAEAERHKILPPEAPNDQNWCPWVVSEDCKSLTPADDVGECNNCNSPEKWLSIVLSYLKSVETDCRVSGEVEIQGEDRIDDYFKITVNSSITCYDFVWSEEAKAQLQDNPYDDPDCDDIGDWQWDFHEQLHVKRPNTTMKTWFAEQVKRLNNEKIDAEKKTQSVAQSKLMSSFDTMAEHKWQPQDKSDDDLRELLSNFFS